MNSAIKRLFHCILFTFFSIMKYISVQLLEIYSVCILQVDFCMSEKYGHIFFYFDFLFVLI